MIRNFPTLAVLLLAALLLVPPASAHPPDEEAHHWATTEASWYGPGFYGHGTYCGQRYSSTTLGVAHLESNRRRRIPCGTLVRLRYRGREVVVPVIDYGATHRGRKWDLSRATCEQLGRCYTDPIDYTF